MIKKIDLENHFYDISSVEALQSRAKGDYPYWDKETNTIHWLEGIAMCQDKFYENLLDFANIRLKIMDELGIEKAVISLAPGIEALPPEESRIACKKANDALYKVMQKFPGRFLGSHSGDFLQTKQQHTKEDLRKRSQYKEDDQEIECILTDESYLTDSYNRKGEYSHLTTDK